ncbi:MAG: site-2 protease family protein, partial [Candidatus Aenigmarchaeota archaeon]|nr:site-2 protease family protein [Candidatus Aenigmarchaeota archaeon]
LKQAFGLALPKVGKVEYPKPFIGIPFWYWIIGIFLIIFPHETFHAIYARFSKIRIKSYGIFLLLIFPLGAFVDIDERKVKGLKLKEKLLIYSSGSFANILVFLTFFLLTILLFQLLSIMYEPIGVKFDVIKNTTAEKINLAGVIQKMNNKTIKTLDDFIEFMNRTRPGEIIEIKTSKGVYLANLVEHPEIPERGFLGVTNLTTVYKRNFGNGLMSKFESGLFSRLIMLFSWIQLLSLGVGSFNMLPIKPLDGGLIYEALLIKISKKHGKILSKGVSIAMLGLLLFNLIGIPIVKSLF